MEGIWYAHFTSGPSQGDGLAVLQNGAILGGDPTHTYKGTYQEDGALVYANVLIAPHIEAGAPSDIEHPFSLFLKGSINGDIARVSGHPNNRPDVTVSVELHKGA
jgi:hypothetical protein